MTPSHILIGVVYNRNGIATWCVEAARALLLAGIEVTLVSTRLDLIPDDLHPMTMITASPGKRGFFQKVAGRINWWAQFVILPSFNHLPLKTAFTQLQHNGNAPEMVLVAQTDFLWPDAPVHQWVVARSWPVSLRGYLAKMKELKSQPWLNRLHDLFFWYKMDHKAYRYATGVLALTNRLASDLSSIALRVHRLYPCVTVPVHPQKKNSGVPRIITAALNLGDKRKNMPLMMEVLGKLNREQHSFELTLVGLIDSATEKSFRALVPQVRFTGSLSRGELLAQMSGHDIFLFTSLQENWGYVLTEAMAMGLAVVTPDVYPFEEINPNPLLRFQRHHPDDLKEKLGKLLSYPSMLNEAKKNACEKYSASFSPVQFCHDLLEAINS